MLDTTNGMGAGRGVLWIAVGRQRVGKTTLLNAAAQFFRARGAAIDVWNGDQQNRAYSLSTFFPDAVTVPDGGIEEGRRWIEERLETLALHRGSRSAVLDIGGGYTGFAALANDVSIAETVAAHGVRPVGLFVIGPEEADLHYLEEFAASGGFLPEACVIVLNAGLVMSGRSATAAFQTVLRHAVVRAAVARGGRVSLLPALSCLAGVGKLGMTYPDILAADFQDVKHALGLFDVARVNRFWTRDLPAFLAELPEEWLPCSVAVPQREVS